MKQENQPGSGQNRNKKLPARLTPVIFAFYMSVIMAALMCLIITAVNQGIGNGYLLAALHAYEIAMPSAFVFIMLVRPIVMNLVARTVVNQ